MTEGAAGHDPTSTDRRDKPRGLNPRYAEVFLQQAMAEAYRHRPRHPRAVIDLLLVLLGGDGGAVLDVGCGPGDLARELVGAAARVDAVDVSRAMLDEGARLEHGDDPRLRWICARVEEAALEPPYALVTAGDSLHWTDWYTTLPRLHDALAPEGALAIVQRDWGSAASEEVDIIRRYSANTEYEPYDLVAELESRDLFRTRNHLTLAEPWRPTVEAYVESRHAQASLARVVLGADRAADFDRELSELLRRLAAERRLYANGAQLDLQVLTTVTWGKPLPGR
jgi:SAM-dependent methyltransferase